MRKLFWIPVLGLFLAACSADDSLLKEEDRAGVPDGSGESRFLAISIRSMATGTRAGEDTKGGDGPAYKDGKDAENHVDRVRCYFFTDSGDAAAVKYEEDPASVEGKYVSYFDWSPSPTSADSDNNVELVLNARIIIDVRQNDRIPFSVVAVLNPSEAYTNSAGSQNLSLDELCAIVRACDVKELSQSKESNGRFVMSNSVYASPAGVAMQAQPVSGHIYKSPEEAMDDPVLIYVERVMARLDLSVTMQPLDDQHPNVYDTGVSYGEVHDYAGDKPGYLGTDGKIYVKFLGWNVTATPDKSRLMKRIDAGWDERLFGWTDEPWNDPLRSRSYWAVNPGEVTYRYGNFGQTLTGTPYDPADRNAANANPDFGTTTAKASAYLQENAARNDAGMQEPYDNTKVIIAAQLVMGDGETPVTIAEWGFSYYTLNGVKTVLADNLDLYRRTGTEGAYRYRKVEPADIVFVTASAQSPELATPAGNGGTPENGSANNKGRCYVYPKLVDDGSTWTQGEGDEAQLLGSYEAADKLVKQLGRVKIWNNGYTYYYFSIAHLGNKGFPGEYGVVRNHIYDAAIISLKGLGTPVYNPEETIYPEKPDNDDSLIAARIQVIKWRIVKKTIQVSW